MNDKRDLGQSAHWVFNPTTGSLTKKTLQGWANDIEGLWYEDSSFRGYDPFYVDADLDKLVKRVKASLSRELKERETAVEHTEHLLDKLENHGKTG